MATLGATLSTTSIATSTDLTDHTGDTSAAHAATAIAFTPAGTIAATDVQAAIEEVAAEAAGASFATPAIVLGTAAAAGAASTVIRSDSTIAAFDATAPVTQAYDDVAAAGTAAFAARRDHKHGMPAAGSGAPADGTYLVTTAHGSLSAEIVVGATPGGELGGTWDTPTVDATHSGSAHADFQPLDSDLTAIAALTTTAYGRGILEATRDVRGMQSYVAGTLAESIPRYLAASNGGLLSTGRLSAVSIPVPKSAACTSMSFLSATTAANVPVNWWFALVDSALNVIRQSTDQLTTAWAANTVKTLTLDSLPVTAGARVASSTVTLTFPTLSEALTSLIANGDSIVVSNANIAAYNGTFTVVTVTSTTITYVSGGSASDSLVAPFPTVQLAAGKRVYTTTAPALMYGVIMVKATTVPTLSCYTNVSAHNLLSPVLVASGNTSLTGTCPSPITAGTGSSLMPWAGIS